MNHLTLLELNGLVRQAVNHCFPTEYWLQAELSEVRESRGHCYLEFVQKDERAGNLVAKARGQIWANQWAYIRPYFIKTTGQMLSAGMQVLVQVQITFHELYGYSLNVLDVDPTYTLGDIARRRREILQTLHDEGVDTMNRDLPLPLLLQRIAVVSSPTAAGYEDFCKQLDSNRRHLAFCHKLFPAVMQGDGVEQSVIQALNAIAEDADRWDVVVIIRGGGATSDLSGFDSLALAENVAQFPLPVITGIGHERDETVIDMIAHTRVKTPTAAAEFLIHHQEELLNVIDDYSERVNAAVGNALTQERNRLALLGGKLPALVSAMENREKLRIFHLSSAVRNAAEEQIARQKSLVEVLQHRLTTSADSFLLRQKNAIMLAQAQIEAADPIRLLRLGFSVTRVNGHAVRSLEMIAPGSVIETTLSDGTVESKVIKTKINNEP